LVFLLSIGIISYEDYKSSPVTTNRFFVTAENILDGRVSFPADLQAQIGRVLRLKPGDEVEALDNRGNCFLARLEWGCQGEWVGKIISEKAVDTEPRIGLTMYFGLTGREKVEWILQKGTEVGVAAFQPYLSRRTLVQHTGKAEKHILRWEKILREAAEQCGRGHIPELGPTLKLKDAVRQAVESHDMVITAWVHESKEDLKSVLSGAEKRLTSIGLFSGPEGGFDPAEIDLMRAGGVRFFSMGKRILRMETAAILAPALVLYELGDMSISE
jgi:16S rRNA (uracil1498-N3)-methyltransferase